MFRQAIGRAIPFCLALQLVAGLAEGACENPVARLFDFRNSVQLREAAVTTAVPAVRNMAICAGDTVVVGERSRARLVFLTSGETFVIDENSQFVVQRADTTRAIIRILRGALLFFSRGLRQLDVETPFVNASVEGTEFLVRVEGDRTVVTVLDGSVRASNPQGMLVVGAGQQAVAIQGQAPQLQVIVRPRDAVQWALYYEPLLPADSLAALDQVPQSDRDARFYLRRAGVLLGVGRLDEARSDIDQALKLAPDDGDAYALRAVIAVALNDRADALENGRQAVERSPQSSTARIALSYALQSDFQLDEARDQLLQAVAAQPNDGQAWARLAELWLSLGYLDRASEAAEKAASVSPGLARTQAVLGFAALARIDINGARAAFERAISLESDSSLARLGLGLAKIRAGDLEEGRLEIEMAAALNPNDPTVRSYLGKAYFDEKRDPLAGRELDLAKTLDPLDPTAWFYDAIRKQTLNRPVEALQDLQRSIELNDNRAVYRSRFLLDADLAARSASLGRIYRDLGFEQLALVEGWKSVGNDPGDYSGHRFLADTYSALPRHEIARVSELLQSQLLQPINISAVQPRLAETNLSILEGSGPADPAFNEFNPLFNRNRLSLLASGAAGGHGILGDEIVVSGVWNKVSFSAGQFHYESDGFQENNGQDRDIFNAFVQASLTPSLGVQGEIRTSSNIRGDLGLRFDPGQLRPFQRQDTDFDSARLGLRRALSPHSDVIASFIYGHVDDRLNDRPVELGFPGNPGSLAVDVDMTGWVTEVQHIYRSERLGLVSGLGHFQANRDEAVSLEIQLPFPPFVIATSTLEESKPNHTNAYVYSQIRMPADITLSLGFSGDFLDGSGIEVDQFNPKAGVTWQATRTTTLRAAGFRTLHRSLISDQTLEPTQVAGFNQLFDGVEGEAAWRYGFGLDQKLSSKLYAGAEYSWRDLEHPSEDVRTGEVKRDDWNERFGRAYLFSTPHPALGLSLEYLFEGFERKGNFGVDQIVELSTHRVPLGVAYFHPSGLIARMKATYVHQDGIFGTTNLPVPGSDTFGVVDGSVSYRLPKRYGLITLDFKNLFNGEFMFQDTDPRFPRIVRGRLVNFRFTVTL